MRTCHQIAEILPNGTSQISDHYYEGTLDSGPYDELAHAVEVLRKHFENYPSDPARYTILPVYETR